MQLSKSQLVVAVLAFNKKLNILIKIPASAKNTQEGLEQVTPIHNMLWNLKTLVHARRIYQEKNHNEIFFQNFKPHFQRNKVSVISRLNVSKSNFFS